MLDCDRDYEGCLGDSTNRERSGICTCFNVGFIAVVEDVQDNGDIMTTLLRKGHRVRWFSSAQTFLAAATETTFDIILLDLKLRDMHGFELYRRLRNVYPDVPVIAVTAESDPATIARAKELGFCEYLMTPILDTETFLATVLHHICRCNNISDAMA
jgi:CheY-like chemotaxis protein